MAHAEQEHLNVNAWMLVVDYDHCQACGEGVGSCGCEPDVIPAAQRITAEMLASATGGLLRLLLGQTMTNDDCDGAAGGLFCLALSEDSRDKFLFQFFRRQYAEHPVMKLLDESVAERLKTDEAG